MHGPTIPMLSAKGENVKTQLLQIRKRIADAAEAAGRPPGAVRLVAVSKTVPADRVGQAIDAGVDILGENYIQEAGEKFQRLGDRPVEWHFIGHLQSNKAKHAVRMFDLIHSVDSLKLAQALDRHAARIGKVQPVLLQVNTGGEDTKSGVTPDDAPGLAKEVGRLAHLSLRGLMTLPPFFDQPERVRPFFRSLRQLAERIRGMALPGVGMEELSMGMSGDFEAAIEEGATLVRIGTAIFGARQ